MRTMREYLTTTVATVAEPLLLAAWLASVRPEGPYVIYENGPSFSCALGALAEVSVDRREVVLHHVDGTVESAPWSRRPLDLVGRHLRALPIVGWRAYGTASFELALANAGLSVAHVDGDLLRLVVPRTEVRFEAGSATIRSVDRDELDTFAELLTQPAPDITTPPRPMRVDHAGAVDYLAAVTEGRDAIRSGALQKVILSRTVPTDFDVDMISTYVTGRRRNTPARSFLLSLGGLTAVGFSPETVLEVDGGGRVLTQPLAGTRALVDDATETQRLRADLLADNKEIYEHAISVKVAYDELRSICVPETVHVTEYMNVKERGTVQHLGSSVTGRLTSGTDGLDALAVLFPAVTASGVPKRAAYDWITKLERRPRGLYAGAVLTIDQDGSLDAAIALRTLFHQAGRTWLQAGAGIVAASIPERELEETREKLLSVASYLVPLARPMERG
jgi:anthranilate synthase component 1/salicylate synthetase